VSSGSILVQFVTLLGIQLFSIFFMIGIIRLRKANRLYNAMCLAAERVAINHHDDELEHYISDRIVIPEVMAVMVWIPIDENPHQWILLAFPTEFLDEFIVECRKVFANLD
jgi:hypothetical protein